MRIWEWDIPVDVKYIADPTMHSMPSVTLAPNGKWLACQSLDNKIVIFSALNRFKMNRKKTFTGHMVSGYACSLDFSPDMRYVNYNIVLYKRLGHNKLISVIWCLVMATVKHTFGIGKLQNCTKNGKRMKAFVYRHFGIHTNRVDWLQLVGMV